MTRTSGCCYANIPSSSPSSCQIFKNLPRNNCVFFNYCREIVANWFIYCQCPRIISLFFYLLHCQSVYIYIYRLNLCYCAELGFIDIWFITRASGCYANIHWVAEFLEINRKFSKKKYSNLSNFTAKTPRFSKISPRIYRELRHL